MGADWLQDLTFPDEIGSNRGPKPHERIDTDEYTTLDDFTDDEDDDTTSQ